MLFLTLIFSLSLISLPIMFIKEFPIIYIASTQSYLLLRNVPTANLTIFLHNFVFIQLTIFTISFFQKTTFSSYCLFFFASLYIMYNMSNVFCRICCIVLFAYNKIECLLQKSQKRNKPQKQHRQLSMLFLFLKFIF